MVVLNEDAVSLACNYWCQFHVLRDLFFLNQSCLLQRCPHIPLPGTKAALFGLPKALLGHLTILFWLPRFVLFSLLPFCHWFVNMEKDEWGTLVESGSAYNETTRPFLLLTGWYSATGTSACSLISLSEKLATQTRVSPSLGVTKATITVT